MILVSTYARSTSARSTSYHRFVLFSLYSSWKPHLSSNSLFATLRRSGVLIISPLVPTVGIASSHYPFALLNDLSMLNWNQQYAVLWNLHWFRRPLPGKATLVEGMVSLISYEGEHQQLVDDTVDRLSIGCCDITGVFDLMSAIFLYTSTVLPLLLSRILSFPFLFHAHIILSVSLLLLDLISATTTRRQSRSCLFLNRNRHLDH